MIPKKAEHVLSLIQDCEKPREVFHCENDREYPFDCAKRFSELHADRLNAFKHNDEHAGDNADQQHGVEHFSCNCVGLENNFVQATSEAGELVFGFHDLNILQSEWLMPIQ